MKLKDVADYLESYGGRDRIMRILYYTAQYAAGVTTSKTLEQKLNSFSDQINSCRTVLRLFDDIPMLCYTLSYGLGREEPDKLLRVCGVAVNILDQLYYPLEHVAWAADSKLIPFNSESWWTASSFCWALSTYLMMIKSLRYARVSHAAKNIFNKKDNKDHWFVRLLIQEMSYFEVNELMTAARCFLDCVHAIHWLPPGILWAGKLRQWHIGALGILSSLLSIYQSYHHKPQ